MYTYFYYNPMHVSSNLCITAWMYLVIRYDNIIVIYIPIMNVLNNFDPVFPSYMSRWDMVPDQNYADQPDVPVLYCLTM